MTVTIAQTTDAAEGLRVLRAEYADGHVVGRHAHPWGQLVYAAAGAIHVTTPERTWLIPPARAVWLPPRAPHRLAMRGRTRLRTIYAPPEACAGLPAAATGLAVTALLRELILALSARGVVDRRDALQDALAGALLAVLAAARPLALALTRPRDPRALAVAQAVEADPARDTPLEALAAAHGVTLRTLQRRFLAETGMPLSEWRQGARLMAAAARLLDGASVTEAAMVAGYGGVSAFITAFRLRFGETPGRFRSLAPP